MKKIAEECETPNKQESGVSTSRPSDCEEKAKATIEEACIKRGMEPEICDKWLKDLIEYKCNKENELFDKSCEEEAQKTYEYCLETGGDETECKKKFDDVKESCKGSIAEEDVVIEGKCEEKAEDTKKKCLSFAVEDILCEARYKYVLNECKKCEEGKELGKGIEKCWEMEEEAGEEDCRMKAKKIIEETCIKQGIDEKECEIRHENLVKSECMPPEPICDEFKEKLIVLGEKLNSVPEDEMEDVKKEIEAIKKDYENCITVKEDECSKLGEKIKKTEEIMNSGVILSDEQEKELNKKLEELKKEAENCIQKVSETEKIKIEPCSELEDVDEGIKEIEEKINRIKSMADLDDETKEVLKDYENKIKNLLEYKEELKQACEENAEVEETPCARLSKVKSIYEEIKNKYAGKEMGEEIKNKLEMLESEISDLEAKCRNSDLAKENIDDFSSLKDAYKAKLEEIVKNNDVDTLEKELKKLEEEKKKIIENFLQKMNEIDLARAEIIKKIKIAKNGVFIDDMKTEASGKVFKLSVGGESLSIIPKGDGITIKTGIAEAEGDIELEYEGDVLISTLSKKPLKVLPSEIAKKFKPKSKIIIIDDGTPKYAVPVTKKGNILGLIPVTYDALYEVSAESGDIITENKPWWTFIVF